MSALNPGFQASTMYKRGTFAGVSSLHGIPGSVYPSAAQVAGFRRREHSLYPSMLTHPNRTWPGFNDTNKTLMAVNRNSTLSARP